MGQHTGRAGSPADASGSLAGATTDPLFATLGLVPLHQWLGCDLRFGDPAATVPPARNEIGATARRDLAAACRTALDMFQSLGPALAEAPFTEGAPPPDAGPWRYLGSKRGVELFQNEDPSGGPGPDWPLGTFAGHVVLDVDRASLNVPHLRAPAEARLAGALFDYISVAGSLAVRAHWDALFAQGETHILRAPVPSMGPSAGAAQPNDYFFLSRVATRANFLVSSRGMATVTGLFVAPGGDGLLLVACSLDDLDRHLPPMKKQVKARAGPVSWWARQDKDGRILLTYLSRVDPSGSIPLSVLRSVSTDTPLCAGTVRDWVQNNLPPPLFIRPGGLISDETYSSKRQPGFSTFEYSALWQTTRASPYVFLLTPGAVPANAPGLLHIVLKSAGPGPAASRSAGPPAPSRPVFSIVRLGARGPILVEMAPPAAGSWDFRLGASEMAASRLAAREGRRPGWHFQLELPGGGPQPVQLIPTIAHDRDLRLPGQLDAPPKDSSPPRPAGGAASSIGGRSSAGGSPSAPESPVSPAALLVASAVEAALGRSSSSGAASLVLERPMGGAASTSRLAERPPTPPEKEPGCPAREEAAAAASPVAPFPSLGAINLATRAAMAQGFGLSEAQLNPLKCGARAAGGGPDSTASSAGLPPCTPPPRLNAAEQSLALAGHWALRDLRLLVGELRGAARGREPWQPSPHWQPLPGATHPDLRMFIRNPALMPALRRSPPAKNPSRFVAGLVDLPGVRPEDVAAAIDTLSARQVWDPMVDDYKRLDRAFTATGAVDLVHVRLKPVAKIERDLVFVGCSYQPPNEPNTLYCVSRSIQATDASTLPTAGQAAGSPELLADPSADDLRQHPSLPKDARTLSCVYLGGWRLELLSDPGAPPVTRAVHIMCNDPCAWVPAMVINRITNALPKKVGELAHFLAAQGAPPGYFSLPGAYYHCTLDVTEADSAGVFSSRISLLRGHFALLRVSRKRFPRGVRVRVWPTLAAADAPTLRCFQFRDSGLIALGSAESGPGTLSAMLDVHVEVRHATGSPAPGDIHGIGFVLGDASAAVALNLEKVLDNTGQLVPRPESKSPAKEKPTLPVATTATTNARRPISPASPISPARASREPADPALDPARAIAELRQIIAQHEKVLHHLAAATLSLGPGAEDPTFEPPNPADGRSPLDQLYETLKARQHSREATFLARHQGSGAELLGATPATVEPPEGLLQRALSAVPLGGLREWLGGRLAPRHPPSGGSAIFLCGECGSTQGGPIGGPGSGAGPGDTTSAGGLLGTFSSSLWLPGFGKHYPTRRRPGTAGPAIQGGPVPGNCPHCGCPIAVGPNGAAGPQPSASLSTHRLFGLGATGSLEEEDLAPLPLMLMLIALAALFGYLVGAWIVRRGGGAGGAGVGADPGAIASH